MTCDVCGQRVSVHSGSEGTNSYFPVAETECERLKVEIEMLAAELRAKLADAVEVLEWFAEDDGYTCLDHEHEIPQRAGCFQNTPVLALGRRHARNCLARLKGG